MLLNNIILIFKIPFVTSLAEGCSLVISWPEGPSSILCKHEITKSSNQKHSGESISNFAQIE